MTKAIAIAVCFLALSLTASAQTLFTYGNDSVTVQEFTSAYKKNNTGPKNPKKVQEYLDLYIASRLKIKEAQSRGYDTVPSLIADMQRLREQILPAYLNDEESLNRLMDEAFTRSQKDVHLAHIYIPVESTGDTAAAVQRAKEAYAKLQRNEDFASVAKAYSADPSVGGNGGDVGYITVFTLPYPLETLVYTTPVGRLAPLYRSASGYHIIKNLGERKAVGRIKAAQILLSFPPDAGAAEKVGIKKRADSLYSRLLKGDDFAILATVFSNDVVSAASGGQMPEFGVGQFDPVFENKVFALPKDGAISPPFLTPYGYHIVKRIAKVPVPAVKDAKTAQVLRDKVQNSDRMNSTKEQWVKRVLTTEQHGTVPFREVELWAYTDSILNYTPYGRPFTLTPTTPLYTIGSTKATVNDWITYAQANRYKRDGSSVKPYPLLWTEFKENVALEHYRANLEKYNPAFSAQLAEFKEGNLFFEIMQQQVWTPAQSDTAALQAYYDKHRSRYIWSKSAEAVIFYAADSLTAKDASASIKKAPANWRIVVGNLQEKLAADSGRFEIAQIPGSAKGVLLPGTFTTPVVNKSDNTASFALVLKQYDRPTPRSFSEARALVVADYQAELERQWVDALKKKYPVVMNQKALAQVLAGL